MFFLPSVPTYGLRGLNPTVFKVYSRENLNFNEATTWDLAKEIPGFKSSPLLTSQIYR
jgi:hypothetical protein